MANIKVKKSKIHVVNDKKVVAIRRSKREYAIKVFEEHINSSKDFLILFHCEDGKHRLFTSYSDEDLIYRLEKIKLVMFDL